MKRFLRFEFSGISALLWAVLFLFPHLRSEFVASLNFHKITIVFISTIVFALPITIYIHQICITLFSPFRQYRLFGFGERKVLKVLREICNDCKINLHDDKCQSILVLVKSFDVEYTNLVFDNNLSGSAKLNLERISEEITSRYSYYYVRMENGLIAPLVGYVLCLISLNLVPTDLLRTEPLIWLKIIPLLAVVQCLMLIAYIPTLLKEIDDLEISLLKIQFGMLKKVVSEERASVASIPSL